MLAWLRNNIEDNGHPGDEWGWAVMGGLRLNAPMIGPGDYFQGSVTYAEGATRYASNTPGAVLVRNGQTVGVSFHDDAGFTGTAATPGIFDLTTAFSVFASYEHFWTPSLRTSIYGSYLDISRGDALNTAMCNSGVAAGGAAAGGRANNCDLDSSYWVIGSRSQWNITKDLYVGVDVMYSKLNSVSLNPGQPGSGCWRSASTRLASRNVTDQDAVSAAWRIHRDIVP